MASYESYPSAEDVKAIFKNTAIALPTGLDYQAAIDAAVSELEERTGWYPFLAGSRQTRFFDPPRFGPSAGRTEADRGGKMLDLGGGLLDLPDDGLRIGVVPNTSEEIGIAQGITSSIGSAGTVLTRDLQYYLLPVNADKENLPWTRIAFMSPVRGVRKSIQLTHGLWGRFRLLPGEVFRAVAERAASILAPEVGLAISRGRMSAKTEHFQYGFAGGGVDGPLAAQARIWDAHFNAVVKRNRRVVA